MDAAPQLPCMHHIFLEPAAEVNTLRYPIMASSASRQKPPMRGFDGISRETCTHLPPCWSEVDFELPSPVDLGAEQHALNPSYDEWCGSLLERSNVSFQQACVNQKRYPCATQ
jgi:hypothetical protein